MTAWNRRVEDLGNGERETAFRPAVDVYEGWESVVIEIELPGVRPEDIAIELDERTLVVSGERRLVRAAGDNGLSSIERSYGTFSRSFSLPFGLDTNAFEAALRDGILVLRVPRRDLGQSRNVHVRSVDVRREVRVATREVRTTGEALPNPEGEFPLAG